jgi:Ser/Thr protein kinase RdoA (MazF antagonist)
MSVFDFFNDRALPRPAVTRDDARNTARELYGVDGEFLELGSNQDRNFRIDQGDRRLLLKFSNPAFGRLELEAQNLAASAVAAGGLQAPTCLVSAGGHEIETVQIAGQTLCVRLLTFVDGEPVTSSSAFTADEARALGSLAGLVARRNGTAHPVEPQGRAGGHRPAAGPDPGCRPA